jgi:hypothetical protein
MAEKKDSMVEKLEGTAWRKSGTVKKKSRIARKNYGTAESSSCCLSRITLLS